MTKAELSKQWELYPDNTVLLAFNGDTGSVMPVTGLLFNPAEGDHLPTLKFQTDEDP